MMTIKDYRPKRPTSLSLENICCPGRDPRLTRHQTFDLRQTKSFSTDIIYQNNIVRGIPFGSNDELCPTAQLTSPAPLHNSRSFSTLNSGDSLSFSEASFDDVTLVTPPQMVHACVATENGKIGPNILKKPKQFPKIKIKTPTNIDFSFAKGNKKNVTSIDHSKNRNSVQKKTTNEDFSFNKSISSKTTKNDYTFGNHNVKAPSRRDFSSNKNPEPKPATKYNYNYAPAHQKLNTRYDYRTNWQPSQPPTRYNYTYYRGYELINTSYDYSYNKVCTLSILKRYYGSIFMYMSFIYQ